LRGKRDQRGRTAAAADEHDGRTLEFVVGDQFVDRTLQRRGRALEDRPRQRIAGKPDRLADPRAGEACRIAIAAGKRRLRNEVQRVCRARRRDRDAAGSIGERGDAFTDRHVRASNRRRVTERRVAITGDVRRARTDRRNGAVLDMRERAARDRERAHVERAQQRAVAADARRPQLRSSAPDHRAVGAGPADFDEDPIGNVFVKERARDAGRRPREHREDRPPLDFGNVHHATVGAHDHQRCGNVRVIDGLARHARGAQHARQDRRVECRRARARAQTVHRRDFAAAGRRKAARSRAGNERRLAFGPVDGKGVACYQRLDARRTRTFEPGVAAAPRRIEIDRGQRHVRGERDRREAHRGAGKRRTEAHDADARNVAFEQRVRRLRGRVRDERHRLRVDGVLAHQALETRDDAGGDAVGVIVRRRHLDRRRHLARRRIDRYDIGERAADVDADPNPKWIALARSTSRRRAPPA